VDSGESQKGTGVLGKLEIEEQAYFFWARSSSCSATSIAAEKVGGEGNTRRPKQHLVVLAECTTPSKLRASPQLRVKPPKEPRDAVQSPQRTTCFSQRIHFRPTRRTTGRLGILSPPFSRALLWNCFPRRISAVACSYSDQLFASRSFPQSIPKHFRASYSFPEHPFYNIRLLFCRDCTNSNPVPLSFFACLRPLDITESPWVCFIKMDLRPSNDVPLLISSANSSSERRVSPSWSIAHFKSRLEPITGIPASAQRLRLGSRAIEAADEESTQLSAFDVQPYAELQVSMLIIFSIGVHHARRTLSFGY
jgi:hypothetical protein